MNEQQNKDTKPAETPELPETENSTPDEVSETPEPEHDAPPAKIPAPQGKSTGKKSSPFTTKKLLLYFLLGIVLAVAICCGKYLHSVMSPVEKVGREIEIIIPSKTKFSILADDLVQQGVIRNAEFFRCLAKWRKIDDKIRVGRFMVRTDWTPDQVLRHLAYGKVHMNRITLPEGLPMWEVGRRLEDAGFVRYADFEAVCKEKTFLRAHKIPLPAAEGFLYPETYLMMRPLALNKTSARVIVGVLVDTFWKRTAPLWGKNPSPEKVKNAVILASIVEKETSVPSERPRVAGVYTNRLRMNMLLQADPTIIYGVGPSFTGAITKRQLADDKNPYNTYKIKGLPPGPICSPGKACIAAALSPEKHRYLYFVAKADGSRGHTFSVTESEHQKAVKIYRARRAKR